MIFLKNSILIIVIVLFSNLAYSQIKDIKIEGLVIDETDYPVPYAALAIPLKYIGTSSNEDGGFSLSLSRSNLTDTLEVSSIGYKTYKIKIQDLVNQKDKTIVLIEDILSLSEVKILSAYDYVKFVQKNLKQTTVSSNHQLNILYRRFSTEHHKSRFLVEHYMKVLDRGPSAYELSRIEVVEGRKSADYRFAKQKQKKHSINYMVSNNPLRNENLTKSYNWKKVGDSRYDGEDLVILEGKGKSHKRILKLYVGLNNYEVYKVETSRLNATYIYKKNVDGKLFLSYHNREANFKVDINPIIQKSLKLQKNKVDATYRHEVIVLGIETEKSKIDVKSFGGFGTDIGDIDAPYSAQFWKTLSMPPKSSFYKKSVKELESNYGVPLKTQFESVNK